MFLTNFAEFLLKRNLQHMIVHVTNHCNFRCQHCFIDFSPKRDLSLESYRRLAAEAGRLFWLDIGGGEPFLRKDLVDIVACFDAQVVQIPTNGSLPDITLNQVAELKRRVSAEVGISLSVDGLEETHEAIRRAKGNWNQLWDTFEKLRQLGGVKIKVNTVLHKDNLAEIIDLMKEIRRRGPDFHSIILLRGDPMNPDYGLPPVERLREIGPEIFAILETYDYGKGGITARILKHYHRYLWNLSLETIERRTQVIPCLAGQAHMVVLGNGDVSACEMLPAVGNLEHSGWKEILASGAFEAQVRSIKNRECFCTHNCAMLDSILFRPASIPHLVHQRIAV